MNSIILENICKSNTYKYKNLLIFAIDMSGFVRQYEYSIQLSGIKCMNKKSSYKAQIQIPT